MSLVAPGSSSAIHNLDPIRPPQRAYRTPPRTSACNESPARGYSPSAYDYRPFVVAKIWGRAWSVDITGDTAYMRRGPAREQGERKLNKGK